VSTDGRRTALPWCGSSHLQRAARIRCRSSAPSVETCDQNRCRNRRRTRTGVAALRKFDAARSRRAASPFAGASSFTNRACVRLSAALLSRSLDQKTKTQLQKDWNAVHSELDVFEPRNTPNKHNGLTPACCRYDIAARPKERGALRGSKIGRATTHHMHPRCAAAFVAPKERKETVYRLPVRLIRPSRIYWVDFLR